MDLFNRDIIGWDLSANMTTKDTVLAAINKVATQYQSEEGMLFHSDRVVQYASKATRNTLKSYKVIQLMSGTGDCWDNAVAESFLKTLKTELIYGTKSIGAKQVRSKIFEYIEIWYKKQRRHSYLGYQTIEEFNNQHLKQNMNNVA